MSSIVGFRKRKEEDRKNTFSVCFASFCWFSSVHFVLLQIMMFTLIENAERRNWIERRNWSSALSLFTFGDIIILAIFPGFLNLDDLSLLAGFLHYSHFFYSKIWSVPSYIPDSNSIIGQQKIMLQLVWSHLFPKNLQYQNK